MRNKSSNRYSYAGHDSRASKFIHKNFNKTDSYNTNFSGAVFENAAFIGAKFKFCSFYEAVFNSCYIRGALFRGANLQNSVFKKCIISATNFDRCKMKGAKFENCKIIASPKITSANSGIFLSGTEVFLTYPDIGEFNGDLIKAVESLRLNDFIRRSSVLHRKEKKLDTVSLKVLVEDFGEQFLLDKVGELPTLITKEFYTLSYISHFLRKLQVCDTTTVPGPAALGAPMSTNDRSSTD
ncbi:pentapeptide repeat-containing protein [Delftia acidovorans]|uniref:pentapeptide repeat-containing protein n=1 Tax=Delftia acidovorans TaxID=80866 RepID=UPI0024331502|nr:pentapeptide repeat-containing protein [Delftia acidovorans]